MAEVARRELTAEPARSGNGGLVIWGWITVVLGLFFWPIFIAPFVIGIVLAARGVAGHGTLLIVVSVIGPFISLLLLAGAIGI